MMFGDDELTELRAQLLATSPERADGPAGGPHAAAAAAATRGLGRQQRDEFLARLGHELRNPMAAIQSTVDYLQAHASGQDPPYLRQARAALVRQTEYMSRLLDVLVRDVEGRSPAAAEREPDAILGLVRRVVELYGGHVTLHEGRPDRGTELRAWLPAAPPEDQRPTTIAPLSTTVSGLRILVVDDNEDAAEMLALVLRTRGFEVALAVDGEQALALARAHPPHVVLLDIGLPGIDGYEVARRLRAMPSSVRPVLVAVTGYGQPADRERSREAGFDHHLVKPMAIETLLPLLVPAGAR